LHRTATVRRIYDLFVGSVQYPDRSASVVICRGLFLFLIDKMRELTKDDQIKKLVEDTCVSCTIHSEQKELKASVINSASINCANALKVAEDILSEDILEVLLAINLAVYWLEIADDVWDAQELSERIHQHVDNVFSAWQLRLLPGITYPREASLAGNMIGLQANSSIKTACRADAAWMAFAINAINNSVIAVGQATANNVLRKLRKHNIEHLKDLDNTSERDSVANILVRANNRARRAFIKQLAQQLAELARSNQTGTTGEESPATIRC
jgi:hypothetical protein